MSPKEPEGRCCAETRKPMAFGRQAQLEHFLLTDVDVRVEIEMRRQRIVSSMCSGTKSPTKKYKVYKKAWQNKIEPYIWATTALQSLFPLKATHTLFLRWHVIGVSCPHLHQTDQSPRVLCRGASAACCCAATLSCSSLSITSSLLYSGSNIYPAASYSK